jgi:pyruvate dehydrogenase E2 component (dihydrolipoamide acetyltransferase)
VAAAAPNAAPGPAPAPRPVAPITAPGRLEPLSNVKRVTARRLSEAKQTVPHFYVSVDVELDALLKLRADLNARSPKEGPGAFKLSVNDLLIKACAVTLRRVPKVNASFTEDGIFLYDAVDISVAVSIPDGLITPIIRNADQKGLAGISTEARGLIERAKAGRLKPEEFQGGSFSISNMGMYGVRDFAAIINPPQAAILAVASGEQRPVVRDGQLAVATVMTVTLSVDHRVIDGALAAEWVSVFRSVVQDPLSLML